MPADLRFYKRRRDWLRTVQVPRKPVRWPLLPAWFCCDLTKQETVKEKWLSLHYRHTFILRAVRLVSGHVISLTFTCNLPSNGTSALNEVPQIMHDGKTGLLNAGSLHNKGKAVPLQAWSGPEGSRKLRFPDFMTTAQDGGKVVSLTHRSPLPPRKYTWYSFLLEAESTSRAIVRPEGLCHWKIPITSSVIEPATYRFVAKCLNHYATARHHHYISIWKNNKNTWVISFWVTFFF